MGLKWGNYKGKNLKPIIESAAIELRVRIDSGELSNVPMFFILEDYGGKQCRAKINYLDLEGGKIDTQWRRIRIPLQAFNYEKRGVNMSNIKELRLEFQRNGHLHIDNIVIVPHDYRLQEHRLINSLKYLIHILSNLELEKNIGGVLIQNIHLDLNLEASLKMRV
jgi:hypothetical protein